VVVLARDGHCRSRLTGLVYAPLVPDKAPGWLLTPILLAVIVGTGCSSNHKSSEPALVIGDSLTAFSADTISRVAHDEHQPVTLRAVSGAASCDMVPPAEQELRDLKKKFSVVIVEFAGNDVTECVRGLRGSVLADVYERDVRDLIAVARRRRLPVVLLGPPAVNISPLREHAKLLDERFEKIANDTAGVKYVDLGKTLSPRGFTFTLPCTEDEKERPGCVDGRIPVRNEDGVHFDVPGPDGYSSGAYRFSRALIGAAKDPD
jgi:hypothetical protein